MKIQQINDNIKNNLFEALSDGDISKIVSLCSKFNITPHVRQWYG